MAKNASDSRYHVGPSTVSDVSNSTNGTDDLVREEQFQYLLDLILQQDKDFKNMSGKHFKDMLDVTTALEERMDKQVLETQALSKALSAEGIQLRIIQDNDALKAFQTLHLAQKLEKRVAESTLDIKMLKNFTGLQKHYEMQYQQEQNQLRKPLPPPPVQTATRPAFHLGHHHKKSFFNKAASSALRVHGLPKEL